MKKDRKYIIGALLVFILLVAIEYNAPHPLDWTYSFSKEEKNPYGSYVTFDFLHDIFPGKNIRVSNNSIYTTITDTNLEKSNYIFINEDFSPDSLDCRKLLDYAGQGNSVFIAASYFSGTIADSLKIGTNVDIVLLRHATDSVSLNFVQPEVHSSADFKFRKGNVDYYFNRYDTAKTQVLGENSLHQSNYIKVNYQQGAFYISTVPLAFTNYELLHGNNAEYLSKALSYLPIANTVWDEYYKSNKVPSGSLLRYVLNNTSLRYAYYVLLCAILLYIIFEGKRKQRVIPVLTPLKNTSVEFVRTVGLLYYQKGTNLGIIQKKIQFFFDYIRTKYNISVKLNDEGCYNSLSQKTNVDKDFIKKLLDFISHVKSSYAADDYTLTELNNMIEDFYQRTT